MMILLKRITLSFLLSAFLFQGYAQSLKASDTIIDGILGNFNMKEHDEFFHMVLESRSNFLHNEIKLTPSKDQFDKARNDIKRMGESSVLLEGDEIVVYVFPENDAPIILTGAYMGAPSITTVVDGNVVTNKTYKAEIYIIIDETSLERLRKCPATTLVYGISEDAEIIWAPLKFFYKSTEFENTIQTTGFYPYKRKATAKEIEEYGDKAFYEDIADLKNTYGSKYEVTSRNVTVTCPNIRPEIAEIAERAKYAFIDRINLFSKNNDKFLDIPYEITMVNGENRQGLIMARVPIEGSKIEKSIGFQEIIYYLPSIEVFRALESYKIDLVNRLSYRSNLNEYARIISGYDLWVVHYNDKGAVTVRAKTGISGLVDTYNMELIYVDQGKDTYFIKSRETQTIKSGIYTLPSKINGLNGETDKGVDRFLNNFLYGVEIKDNIEPNNHDTNKTQLSSAIVRSNWKLEYNTKREFALGQTNDITPEQEKVESIQNLNEIESPSFRGGNLESFQKWVNSQIIYPDIAIENGISGNVMVAFVIEKDGLLTNIEVLSAPHRSLSDEVVRIIKKSPKWHPGTKDNKLIRVKFSMPVSFKLE